MVWNAGMRDQAACGLVRLLARPEWRDSDRGPALAAAVGRLITDPNPVVRMQAAPGLALLHVDEDPEQRLAAVRTRLLAETDPHVLNVLIRLLSNLAGDIPAQVDDVLSELSQLSTGGLLRSHSPMAKPGQAGDRDTDGSAWSGDLGTAETAGPLLAFLATVPRTPFASAALDDWFSDPITYQDRVERLLHELRPYLNTPSGRGRDNAFRLLTAAAQATRDTWLARGPQRSTPGRPTDESEMARVRAAALVAHGVAQQLYLASGAFDEQPGIAQQPAERGNPETFARQALPVLQPCGQVTEPQVTQPVVETLVHLAGMLQREALLAIASAVPARGAYVTDPLAAGTVLPYLRRSLAEQRDLVLANEEGIAALRHLLQAFAGAGNADALELAYSFADVFR
jgi:hypothetical protein